MDFSAPVILLLFNVVLIGCIDVRITSTRLEIQLLCFFTLNAFQVKLRDVFVALVRGTK